MTDTPAPAAGTFAADPLFATFDAETQGHFKNRGWDQKPVAEVARDALKSWQEAEKFVGVPKDQIIRMPKDAADEAGWKALRTRIGVPEDVKGYSFADVKRADGTAADTQLIEAVAPALHSAGVPKDAAPEVVKAVVKFLDGAAANEVAERQAKQAIERDALNKDWGPNLEANKFIAKQAALKIGLSQAEADALESAAGYKNTMSVFLKLGQLMGEDKFVSNPSGGVQGVMTGSQAQARLTELKSDAAWVTKINSGDAAATREFNALCQLIAA